MSDRHGIFEPDEGTNDYSFSGHRGTGPSGAHRWMNCTGSLGAAKEFLGNLTPGQAREFARGNTAARQGTTAHAAAEAEVRLMLGEIEPAEYRATITELVVNPEDGEEYTEEMGVHVAEYVNVMREFIDVGREVRVETKVGAVIPLTGSHEDEVYVISGSADGLIPPKPKARAKKDKNLVVLDYKHGEGVDVEVEENPQTRIYALGALSEIADEDGNLPEITSVDYYIVQPRLGGIKTWSESVDDLLAWRDDVLAPALTAALYGEDEGAQFRPSDEACEWCPARGTCSALAESVVASASSLFDAVTEAEFENGPGSMPDVTALSDERLGVLLDQIMALEGLKDDLKAEAQRRQHRGHVIPGFKMVGYTPSRKWRPEATEVLSEMGTLRDEIGEEATAAVWKKSLLTPKQAVAAMKAAGVEDAEDVLAPYVEAAPPRPVIAREGDRRKTWSGAPPERMFDALG